MENPSKYFSEVNPTVHFQNEFQNRDVFVWYFNFPMPNLDAGLHPC